MLCAQRTSLKLTVLSLLAATLTLASSQSYIIDQWRLQNESSLNHPNSNFEIDRENSLIIVTTTNTIFHLDLGLTTQSNVIVEGADDEDFDSCYNRDFRATEDCQNYPNVLVLPQGQLPVEAENGSMWNASSTVLLCSSNAYSPKCYYRSRSNLSLIRSYESPRFNPFGPYTWIPSLWTTTGKLVVATPQDSLLTKFGVTMSHAPFAGEVLVTTRTNQRFWFNKSPDFVSMYEIGEFIYIFFREEAIEAGVRVRYSRVARLCKEDAGSLLENRQLFRTFLKARISCTSNAGMPGSIDYHYNEIYGTYYDASQHRIYAVFKSAQYGPLGSAVCSYTMDPHGEGVDLETVFSKDYLVEQGANHFISQRNFEPFTCDTTSRSPEDPTLMASAVTQQSLLVMEGFAFQNILSDTINQHRMLFITATRQSDGALVLLKVLLTDGSPSHRLMDTIVLASPSSSSSSVQVTKMELYGSAASAKIYIATKTHIFRVPVQNCASLASCCACIAARDPYCGVDPTSGECGVVGGVASVGDGLVQDVVDGNASVCAAIYSSSSSSSSSSASSVSETEPTNPVRVRTCGTGAVGGDNSGGDGNAGDGGDGSVGNAGGGDDSTVTPPGGPTDSGSPDHVTVGVEDTTKASPTFNTPRVEGLGPISRVLHDYKIWIIVGTVGGFIVGVVLGVVTVMLYRRAKTRSRNRKTHDLTRPRAITNDTNAGGNARGNAGGQGKEHDVLRINNSTCDFTSSNNFTRSGNNYTRHMPPHHLKEPPSPPLKEPLTPKGAAAAAGCSANADATIDTDTCAKKCQATPTATPPPHPEFTPGDKASKPPSVFTFTPSSIHAIATPTRHAPSAQPKSPPYATSVSGASAYSSSSCSCSDDVAPYQVPVKSLPGHLHGRAGGVARGGAGGRPPNADPNVQLNYKARVYLTNSERENYGRNILARLPSVDGSKSKYRVADYPQGHTHSGGNGHAPMMRRLSSSSTMYASESLPRMASSHHHQQHQQQHQQHQQQHQQRQQQLSQGVLQLDSELGCSQC